MVGGLGMVVMGGMSMSGSTVQVMMPLVVDTNRVNEVFHGQVAPDGSPWVNLDGMSALRSVIERKHNDVKMLSITKSCIDAKPIDGIVPDVIVVVENSKWPCDGVLLNKSSSVQAVDVKVADVLD